MQSVAARYRSRRTLNPASVWAKGPCPVRCRGGFCSWSYKRNSKCQTRNVKMWHRILPWLKIGWGKNKCLLCWNDTLRIFSQLYYCSYQTWREGKWITVKYHAGEECKVRPWQSLTGIFGMHPTVCGCFQSRELGRTVVLHKQKILNLLILKYKGLQRRSIEVEVCCPRLSEGHYHM